MVEIKRGWTRVSSLIIAIWYGSEYLSADNTQHLESFSSDLDDFNEYPVEARVFAW